MNKFTNPTRSIARSGATLRGQEGYRAVARVSRLCRTSIVIASVASAGAEPALGALIVRIWVMPPFNGSIAGDVFRQWRSPLDPGGRGRMFAMGPRVGRPTHRGFRKRAVVIGSRHAASFAKQPS